MGKEDKFIAASNYSSGATGIWVQSPLWQEKREKSILDLDQ